MPVIVAIFFIYMDVVYAAEGMDAGSGDLSDAVYAASGDLQAEVRQCRTIDSATDRLDCYDAIEVPVQIPRSDQTQIEIDKEPQVAIDKPVKADQEQLGEKYIAAQKERKRKTPKASKQLINAKKDSKSRWQFYFADGQIWRQLEARYFSKPALPAQVTISEGMLGRHILRIDDGSKSTKVKRIR